MPLLTLQVKHTMVNRDDDKGEPWGDDQTPAPKPAAPASSLSRQDAERDMMIAGWVAWQLHPTRAVSVWYWPKEKGKVCSC